MPLHDFLCHKHGLFEVLIPGFDPPKTELCPECGDNCERQVALCSMQPDKYWNGAEIAGQYFESTKEYKEIMKNLVPATRENKEQVIKNRQRRIKERKETEAKQLDEFVQRTVQDYDEKPDGALTHKQRRKLRQVDQS